MLVFGVKSRRTDGEQDDSNSPSDKIPEDEKGPPLEVHFQIICGMIFQTSIYCH